MAIYKRGKTWWIDYYANGQRYRESVGPNRRSAERALAKRKVEIAENRFLDKVKRSCATFDELAKLFLDYADNNKLSAERDHRSVALLQEVFGGMKLGDITPLSVEQYKNMRRKSVGPATVNRELAALKTMFSKAILWDMASENPVKKVQMFREPAGRIRYLSRQEIADLLRESVEHLRPIIMTALYTGMRKSEILRMRWDDVDLKHRIIYVRTSKNGQSREIPIATELMEVLERLARDSDRVFTRSDGGAVDNIKTCFYNAVRRAGIEGFSFHDLRHTFASYLVMSGVDLLTVKELLGHKTIQMTLRYAHLSPSHKRSAVDALSYSDGHNMVTRTGSSDKKVARRLINRYPASLNDSAGVVELVDTRDLKSLGP